VDEIERELLAALGRLSLTGGGARGGQP
jgi:hypothetical protein